MESGGATVSPKFINELDFPVVPKLWLTNYLTCRSLIAFRTLGVVSGLRTKIENNTIDLKKISKC